MAQTGKEMMDAYAAAFPNKNIKLPIGGMKSSLMSKLTPPGMDGTYSTLARDIEDYVYGNASLGIPAQPYANRFYMQRNTLNASWQFGTIFDNGLPPDFDSDNYIRSMIRQHAQPVELGGLTPGQAGIQMVAAATGGITSSRQRGGAGPRASAAVTHDAES